MNQIIYIPLKIIILFCFWFAIGVYAYKNLFKGKYSINLKNYIKNLNLIELIILLYLIFYSFSFIISFFLDYFINFEILNYSLNLYDSIGGSELQNFSTERENTSCPHPSHPSLSHPSYPVLEGREGEGSSINDSTANNKLNNKTIAKIAVDIGVLTVGLVVGFKAAQFLPTLAGKAGVVAGSVVLSGAAILTKNVLFNLNKDLSYKYITNLNLEERVSELFNLTGNHAIDTLLIVHNLHEIQLFLLFLISYNYIISLINEKTMENLLLKYLNIKIVNYLIKLVKGIKKTNKIILICLFILLIISTLIVYYCLNFYVLNIEAIMNFYFKK